MRERPRRQAGSEGKCWYCPDCKTTKSIRHGSFFSRSKLSLQKWMILLLWWSREYPVIDASKEAEVKEDTACDILYQWLREVCSTKLISMPIVLGGPGKIVQIDESLFHHKPKVGNHYICILLVNSSLQNHRGRLTSTEKWVFGIVHTSFSPSLGYMELKPNRQAATLLPIIQAHVARGTTVYSDGINFNIRHPAIGAQGAWQRHPTFVVTVYMPSGRGLKSMAVITLVETELVYSNKICKRRNYSTDEDDQDC